METAVTLKFDLNGILGKLQSGEVPEYLLHRSRGTTRVFPIEATIEDVAQGLSRVGNMQADILNPEQYKRVETRKYLAELDTAFAIMSLLRRGVDGVRPWPKNRDQVPHMAKLEELRAAARELNKGAESAYNRWKTANGSELGNINQALDGVASALNTASTLEGIYSRLSETLKDYPDESFSSVAKSLGCERNIEIIIAALEKADKTSYGRVSSVKVSLDGVRMTLEKEARAHEEGTFYTLSKHELGQPTVDEDGASGLFFRLETAEAGLAQYLPILKGKKKPLFKGGITEATPERRQLIEAMKAISFMEALLTKANEYGAVLSHTRDNLKGGVYLTPEKDRAIDIDKAAADYTEKMAAVSAYKTPHQYLSRGLGKFEELRGLAGEVKEAYAVACAKLASKAAQYIRDDLTINTRSDLTDTKSIVVSLVNEIDKAKKFSIKGVVDAGMVVSDKTYATLTQFKTVLEDAESRLSGQSSRSYSSAAENFESYANRAIRYKSSYGLTDYDTTRALSQALQFLGDIPESARKPFDTSTVDPRVRPLFEGYSTVKLNQNLVDQTTRMKAELDKVRR